METKKGMNSLTEADRELIISEYKKGTQVEEIADTVGTYSGLVSSVAINAGCNRRCVRTPGSTKKKSVSGSYLSSRSEAELTQLRLSIEEEMKKRAVQVRYENAQIIFSGSLNRKNLQLMHQKLDHIAKQLPHG